jgi:hypothetical protein
MTDNELLELAAKAAGIDWFRHAEGGLWSKSGGIWKPLTDDGDALRLAVKLKMVVDMDWNGGSAVGTAEMEYGEPEYGYQEGHGKKDPYAATRRAIVRAAAEIGKEMK